MKKSFTVIIPFYNTEKYIRKCLDSLVNQNYDISLIQILIIDDGSTNDEIKKILIEYQNKYPNIEYFKKENGNWGSVINYVLKNKLAKNDYVSTLDSDDFLNPNTFQIINSLIKDNDLFVGSCRKWNGNKCGQYFSPYYFPFKRKLKNNFQMQTPICLPMLFFYKKEIFYKTKELVEKIPHQDGIYISQIISNSQNLIFTYKVIGYYYISRFGNSMTKNWDDNRLKIEYDICKNFLENNNQELISFRLNLKEFKRHCKKNNIKFIIKRKFYFSWLPFGLRTIYFLIFYFMHKKFFTYLK